MHLRINKLVGLSLLTIATAMEKKDSLLKIIEVFAVYKTLTFLADIKEELCVVFKENSEIRQDDCFSTATISASLICKPLHKVMVWIVINNSSRFKIVHSKITINSLQ